MIESYKQLIDPNLVKLSERVLFVFIGINAALGRLIVDATSFLVKTGLKCLKKSF